MSRVIQILHHPKFQWLLIIILILMASVSLLRGSYLSLYGPSPSLDFFWPAAHAITQKINPYTPPLSGAVNFASSLILLFPYTFLNWDQAITAWLASNFVFTALLIYCLLKLTPQLSTRLKWIIALLIIGSTPFRVSLGNGQHCIFAMAFTLFGLINTKKSPIAAGIYFAIGLFKYHLIAPLLLLPLLRGHWKSLVIAAAIHVSLLFGVSLWLHTDPVTLTKQTIHIAQLVQHDGWLDIPGLIGPQVPKLFIYGLLASIVTAICWILWKHRHRISDLDILAITSIISMLVTYHRIYDFVLLAIPLLWALTQRPGINRPRLSHAQWILVGWIIAIWYGENIVSAMGLDTTLYFRLVLSSWGVIALTMSTLEINTQAKNEKTQA